MEHVIGSFGLPPSDVARPISLYVRSAPGAWPPRVLDGLAHLGAGDSVSFDTYFGGFSAGKWARHTNVRRLAVDVVTSGPVRIELVHTRLGASPRVVAELEHTSTAPTTHSLTAPALDELGGGSLHVRVAARGGSASVSGGTWRTDHAPRRAVALGVVITTFNRAEHLRANLTRLDCALASHPTLGADLSVVVVDNGRNLELVPLPATDVTLLANRNTGGAGGFTRGLMHLRATARTTHVLFMDDDVSFDPEIIARTIALLQHADDDRLCIAGAMLANERPAEIFEAGAGFCGTRLRTNRPVGQGLRLDDPRDLLRAEEEQEPIDYGAWWYYAFPIDLTAENPVPAFVRGDDVLWGLLHAGDHTITCNGIGLWHDSFEAKNGPHAWFYETRNLALVGVLAVPGYRWRHLLTRYVNLCGRSMLSLKYDSAANITFAVREFLRGPDHWLSLDQAALNDQVAAFSGERIDALPPDLLDLDELPRTRGLVRLVAALASLATLGGHLLPPMCDRRRVRATDLPLRVLGASVGQRAIVFRDTAGTRGFVARRDRRRFFALFGAMVRTAAVLPLRFGRVRRAYRAAYPEMVSDAYWQGQFGIPTEPAGDVVDTATRVPA